MTTDSERRPYSAPVTVKVPMEGLFFDRVDSIDTHSRTYYLDGKVIGEIRATMDPDHPGKWVVVVRWMRRSKELVHGWGPLDTEQAATQLLDAVGIGAECREAAVFLGHAQEGG